MEQESNISEYKISEFMQRHLKIDIRDILCPAAYLIWIDHIKRIREESGTYWYFKTSCPKQHFALYSTEGCIVLKRKNEGEPDKLAFINLTGIKDLPCLVHVSWTMHSISLKITVANPNDPTHTHTFVSETDTNYFLPSNSILDCIHFELLSRKQIYNSEFEFFTRAISIISDLQSKIHQTSNVNEFWNITKKGHKIISRTPKDEVDIQSALLRMMADQVKLAGITVTQEVDTGNGRIDYIFSAYIENQGTRSIAIEVKHAHSIECLDGLHKQLPSYMRNKRIQFGIYIVLWYKCDWFDKPSLSLNSLLIDLGGTSFLPKYKSTENHKNIRIEVLNFTKKRRTD